MMKADKNIPALRFPEFEGEWKDHVLGDISVWKSGGTPSKEIESYWGGEIPWITAASMRGHRFTDSELHLTFKGAHNGTTIVEKGTLLILVRGSMLFNRVPVGIAERTVTFNQDVKAISFKNKTIPDFMLNWILSKESKILNMVMETGIGAGKLDTNDLKGLIVFLPILPEQYKISSFLASVDQRIHLLNQKKEKLEQYKKGIMQQIFSQELRFRDENGQEYPMWTNVKLFSILNEHLKKNSHNKIAEVFSVSKDKGVVNQIEHLGRSYAAENITHYKIVEPFDIIYTKSPTSNFPFGIIKQNITNRTGVVSPLYAVFKPITRALGTILHYHFLSWVNTYNYLVPLVQKGPKNTMNINNTDFLNGNSFVLPTSLAEQQKIASFLSSLDDKITQVNTQLDLTRKWKQGLLQQMFV